MVGVDGAAWGLVYWERRLVAAILRGASFMIGVFPVTEMVLNARTLPEPLFRMIRTEKVKVNENNGVISLTPVVETAGHCPLRGLAADSTLTVDDFLAMSRNDKELEQ